MTPEEQLAIEILEALEPTRTQGQTFSKVKLERWVRNRFNLRRKKCDGCQRWLPFESFAAATGYKLNRAKQCAACVRHDAMYPPGCQRP